MLMRFTTKLSKKLKLPPLTKVTDDPGPFLDWYANLFTANRVQYILTTEAQSLFSVVMYGRGITDDHNFIKQWLGSTRDYLTDIGKDFVFEKIIGPNTGQFTLSKTLSKSVLGSMNDMVSVAKFMLRTRDMSPRDLAEMINETPFKAIDHNAPIHAFNQMKFLRPI